MVILNRRTENSEMGLQACCKEYICMAEASQKVELHLQSGDIFLLHWEFSVIPEDSNVTFL